MDARACWLTTSFGTVLFGQHHKHMYIQSYKFMFKHMYKKNMQPCVN